MSEWPEGWFRDGQEPGGASAGADRTVGIQAPGGTPPADHPGVTRGTEPSAWPDQPPPKSGRGSWRSWASGYGSGGGWRRWLRPKRIAAVTAILIGVLLIATVGTYFYLNSRLHRSNILVDYSGRPAPGSGTNWLITGSDSRQGLSRKQELKLSVGRALGSQRSDTILILHIPAGGGKPLLISIPRDSYVTIPGHGGSKINAAFSYGGPKLLAQTVQNATGLYISHYMGIGFGGFVNVVNDVGGVRMCLKQNLRDPYSGIHLRRGCHTMNGTQALAYVRDRHNFATSDLQREQDQRLFLKALLAKMTSTGVMVNPFRSLPAAVGVSDTLTVDNGTSLYDLISAAMALRGAQTTTVPIGNPNFSTPAGDAVQWSDLAKTLFQDLQAGKTVPKKLITGSHQAA
jgi:LCP family protein required for cell wall assembly